MLVNKAWLSVLRFSELRFSVFLYLEAELLQLCACICGSICSAVIPQDHLLLERVVAQKFYENPVKHSDFAVCIFLRDLN